LLAQILSELNQIKIIVGELECTAIQ